jgi:hypothetical protein
MNVLRNLTVVLALALAAMGPARAGSGDTAAPARAEPDREFGVEMSEAFSGALVAVLLANACVLGAGACVARRRMARERRAAQAADKSPDSILDPHLST